MEKSDENRPAPEATDAGAQSAAITQWHRLLGGLLQLLLAPVGITVQSEVQVMSDPPKVDVLLLRREGVRWTANQMRLLPDGVRNTTAQHVLIEFKYAESLTDRSLQQALGYDYFYRQSQQLDDKAIQTFVMSARTPRPAFLKEHGYRTTELAGVYVSEQRLLARIPLLMLNELADEAHNAFVQCFASRRPVRNRAFARLGQMNWQQLGETLWDFVIGLRSQMKRQGENDVVQREREEGLTPEKVLAIGKQMRQALLATLTPEERRRILATLPPEELLADLTPEERLAGLAPEERLAGLAPEERLAGLAPDELSALLARIESYLHQ